MKMRIEVLALIVMGLVVLGGHAMDMDWEGEKDVDMEQPAVV